MRLSFITAGVLSAGLLSVAPSFAAPIQLVTNGGFETGTLANWSVALTANGVTDVQTVESFDTTGSGASNSAKFEVGRTSVNSGDPAGVVLSQVLRVTSTADIDFSVDIAALNTRAINADLGTFRLLFGGTLVDELSFREGGPGEVKRGSLSGSLTGVGPADYTLQLFVVRGFRTGDLTPFQYVDNVSVLATYDDVSVIPLPASGLLLLAGMGGLAFARRRRT